MRSIYGLLAIALLQVLAGLGDPPKCHALLVGVNAYADKAPPSVPDLACTHSDCVLVESLLPVLTGLPPEAICATTLLDDRATKAGVIEAIEGFADSVAPGDTVVIYFSGHGALVPDFDGEEPAGDGALILHDFDRRDRPPTEEEVAQGALTDDEMAQLLRRFAGAARVFYVADCCHSGGNERDVGELAEKGFELPLTQEQRAAPREKGVLAMPDGNRLGQDNVVAIFACDSRSKAQELRSAGHGAMTLCLSELLADPAAYDADGDGVLEVEELSAGLRALVERTVREYSNGTRHQLSFVKSLRADIWAIPLTDAARATNVDGGALRGVPEESLTELIELIEQRCGGRYDAGIEPYELLSFSFMEEDGAPRADNVYLESELTDPSGHPRTTLMWRFELDRPADVLALVVDASGDTSLVFPNSAQSIAAQLHLGLKTDMRVGAGPFTIPDPEYFGTDRFVIDVTDGWEYVVLVCSPVALEDPYGVTGTRFDLVHPFEALAGKSELVETGSGQKGLDVPDQPPAFDTENREVVADGKRLTVFAEKYWLLR